MKINTLISVSDFVTEIEKLVIDKNVDYIDACVLYAERNNVEVETVAALVKQSVVLKGKLEQQAEDTNMLKKHVAV